MFLQEDAGPVNKIGMDYTKKNTLSNCVAGSTASTNYTGQLLDGTIFDSNQIAKFGHMTPFDFKVGAGKVIKCWDYAV